MIDSSKFRFRIGDKVLWNNEVVKIVAYYFTSGFNSFNSNYGYTIEMPNDTYHTAGLYSYDRFGNHVRFTERNKWYTIEEKVESLVEPAKITWDNLLPGDKVQVIPRVGSSKSYYCTYLDKMVEMEGSILTVRNIFPIEKNSRDSAKYTISVEEDNWNWTDRMLKIVNNMDNKEIKINIPEGYEIDKENSTFECIKFKKKTLSLVEILREYKGDINVQFNKISPEMSDRLESFFKLRAVADYLNDGWKPDWNDIDQAKFIIKCTSDKISVASTYVDMRPVVFKSITATRQAIEILGEDIIRKFYSL